VDEKRDMGTLPFGPKHITRESVDMYFAEVYLNALFSHTIWSMLPIHCSGGLMIMSMLGRHSHLLLEAIL